MKKIKMILDIMMIIIIFLVLNVSFTGIFLHELLGITIWVLFITHLVLNYKWIKSITKNIFSNKVKAKTKQLYLIDCLLFLDFILITMSGIFISQKLFVFLNASDIYLWTKIHELSSYFAIILIIIHLVMHYSFFLNQFSKSGERSKETARFLTITLISVSTFALIFNVILSKLKESFTNKLETDYTETEVDSEVTSETAEVNSTTAVTSTTSSEVTSTSTSSYTTTTEDEETSISEAKTDEVSLSEYLGSLICTGCGRRCPLSNPRCGRGEEKAEAATEDYYEIYG